MCVCPYIFRNYKPNSNIFFSLLREVELTFILSLWSGEFCLSAFMIFVHRIFDAHVTNYINYVTILTKTNEVQVNIVNWFP